jgi:hypothetical protein
MRRHAAQAGQASVELVALVPVVVVVALTLLQALAAGAARVYAGHAAEAGAVALLQHGDARRAARDALPGWSARPVQVRVQGSAVTVSVRPVTFLPGLAAALTSTVHADAGGTA